MVLMPEYAPYFIGGLGLYLIHRYGSDLLPWGIVVVSFLLGQHYAVTALWHAGRPGDFAHRTTHRHRRAVVPSASWPSR